ncbi:hypothetical protein B0H14DRAFT_3540913 [Mycena olivaceomarginata]|nr:hypothetical protein B0H14DRAFT_3540913 [Mycena olivaceomarginata]
MTTTSPSPPTSLHPSSLNPHFMPARPTISSAADAQNAPRCVVPQVSTPPHLTSGVEPRRAHPGLPGFPQQAQMRDSRPLSTAYHPPWLPSAAPACADTQNARGDFNTESQHNNARHSGRRSLAKRHPDARAAVAPSTPWYSTLMTRAYAGFAQHFSSQNSFPPPSIFPSPPTDADGCFPLQISSICAPPGLKASFLKPTRRIILHEARPHPILHPPLLALALSHLQPPICIGSPAAATRRIHDAGEAVVDFIVVKRDGDARCSGRVPRTFDIKPRLRGRRSANRGCRSLLVRLYMPQLHQHNRRRALSTPSPHPPATPCT